MWIFLYSTFLLSKSVWSLHTRTRPGYIHVDWQLPEHPSTWQLWYQVMGTSYHSVAEVPGSRSSANISTTDYPGSMYMIRLYSTTNNTRGLKSTAFIRADCSRRVDSVVGAVYSIQSHDYPKGSKPGTICSWTFTGSDDVWYVINIIDRDFDVGSSMSCTNYLEINNVKLCDNTTRSDAVYIENSTMSWKLITTSGPGRGISANVSAVHRLEAPHNVSAAAADNVISVTWREPRHHPGTFDYILHVSHFPHVTHSDLHIPGNTSAFSLNVTSHMGQTYRLQMKTATPCWTSPFSEQFQVQTSCNRTIHIAATESYTLTSEQFPFGYLPGLSCHYHISTDPGFLFRVLTSNIDIDGGDICQDTFFKISGGPKVCAERPPSPDVVIQQSLLDVRLFTGQTATGKGINVTFMSVPPPPSAPTNIRSNVKDREIQLLWGEPVAHQSYITGYVLEYFIVPRTPGATVRLPATARDVTVNTGAQAGRLYMIRLAAATEGGLGPYARPVYARAACGGTIRLSRDAYVTVQSPNQNPHRPGVLCRWNLVGPAPLWIKLDVKRFELETSPNCSKDYLEISGFGRCCGNMTARSFIARTQSLNITFVTDYAREMGGFMLHVTAAGPTPGPPQNLTVVPTDYSLLVSWSNPVHLRGYVTGFKITYLFHDNYTTNTERVPKDTYAHVLDMTSHPGKQVAVWVQAEGDTGNSDSTDPVFTRNACGRRITISQSTYLSSPYYKAGQHASLYCSWTLTNPGGGDLTLTFLEIHLDNRQGCDNMIQVSSGLRLCDDTYQQKPFTVRNMTSITVEFRTGARPTVEFFLLEVQATAGVAASSRQSMPLSSSSAVRTNPSVPALLASIVGTVLASSVISTDIAEGSQVCASPSRARSATGVRMKPTLTSMETRHLTTEPIGRSATSADLFQTLDRSHVTISTWRKLSRLPTTKAIQNNPNTGIITHMLQHRNTNSHVSAPTVSPTRTMVIQNHFNTGIITPVLQHGDTNSHVSAPTLSPTTTIAIPNHFKTKTTEAQTTTSAIEHGGNIRRHNSFGLSEQYSNAGVSSARFPSESIQWSSNISDTPLLDVISTSTALAMPISAVTLADNNTSRKMYTVGIQLSPTKVASAFTPFSASFSVMSSADNNASRITDPMHPSPVAVTTTFTSTQASTPVVLLFGSNSASKRMNAIYPSETPYYTRYSSSESIHVSAPVPVNTTPSLPTHVSHVYMSSVGEDSVGVSTGGGNPQTSVIVEVSRGVTRLLSPTHSNSIHYTKAHNYESRRKRQSNIGTQAKTDWGCLLLVSMISVLCCSKHSCS